MIDAAAQLPSLHTCTASAQQLWVPTRGNTWAQPAGKQASRWVGMRTCFLKYSLASRPSMVGSSTSCTVDLNSACGRRRAGGWKR